MVTKNICIQACQGSYLEHGSLGGRGQSLEAFGVGTVRGDG